MTKQLNTNQAIISAVLDICEHLGLETTTQNLLAELGRLELKTPSDGRAAAWDSERREKFGAKIKQAWAAKREAKKSENIYNDTFYAYKFSDVKPEAVVGRKQLAEYTDLALGTINNKLHKSPDGFTLRRGRLNLVFARNDEAKDRLCQAPYLLSGNSDDLIVLPSKKSNRF